MAYNKIGFHTGPGGNAKNIDVYMQQLDAAGIPFSLKAVDDYGVIHQSLAFSNADHVRAFRLSNRPNNGPQYDTPNYSLPPEEAAVAHWNMTLAGLPPEFDKSVWLEVINEPDKNRADWLGWFGVKIAELAQAAGYKVALFGFSGGEPEPTDWETPGMLAYLAICAERPQTVAVALHEYSFTIEDIWALDADAAGPEPGWLVGRFQHLHAVCDKCNIPRPTILITEWGWEYENVPGADTAMEHIADIAALYAQHPNILGAGLWYLGGYFGGICDRAQPLILPVTNYTLTARFPDPPPIEPPDGGEGGTVEITTPNNHGGYITHLGPGDKVLTLRPGYFDGNTFVKDGSKIEIPLPDTVRALQYVSIGEKVIAVDCPENPNPPVSEKFAIGDRVEITANALNVRAVPSLEGTIVTALPKGSRGTVNDGPTLADNVIWWHVVFDADVTGWCSEAWLEYETASKNPLDGLVLGKPFAVPYALTSPFNAPRSYANGLHEGVDYDVLTAVADSQEPILCLYPGTVDISIDSSGGYGKYVRVRHERNGSTFYTRYAHMDERFVTVGQTVDIGDALGEIGTTGNVTGEHVHINLEVPGYGSSGYVVADVVDPHPYIGSSPAPPPTVPTYDILDYMVGTHRQQHTLQYTWAGGGTQTIQIMQDGNEWRYVKGGGQYEQLYYDDNWIYRAEDTSESADRFYTQSTNGTLGAAWVKRRMAIGETVFTEKQVQHYLKDGCVPQNGGLVTDALKLTAVYPAYTFDSGIVLKDVIRLEWAAGEGYLFAKGYGLGGFEFSGGKSYISELALQGRDDLPVNVPSCLDLSGRYYV